MTTKETHKKIYPTLWQALAITLLLIISMAIVGGAFELSNVLPNKDLKLLLGYLLGTIGPLFWVYKLSQKNTDITTSSLSFSTPIIMLLSVVAVICLQIGVTVPLVSSIPMPDTVKQMFLELSKNSGIFTFIATVVAAPLIEEYIFRGVILKGFLKQFTPIKAILISSFLFAFVHFNPWQFVTAMLIGSFSGWLYYNTQKISLSIIIHFANNLFAVLWGYIIGEEKFMEATLSDTYGGFTNAVVIISTAIVLAIVCVVMLKKQFSTNKVVRKNTSEEFVIS